VAFSRETEAHSRRMALDICQEQIRQTLNTVRELTNMVSDFSESKYKDMDEYLFKIMKFKEEAVKQKRLLLSELARSGMLLTNREDFVRLSVYIVEIADFCEGVSHRINYLAKRKIDIVDEIRVDIFNICRNVLKTVTNLRETIFSLTYSREKAMMLAEGVDIAEYTVDDIADKAEDATDSIRILALVV